MLAKNVTDLAQQKALLLHTAGIAVQDIYHMLTEEAGDADVYTKAARALDNYFHPWTNIPYERHIFRQLQWSSWTLHERSKYSVSE